MRVNKKQITVMTVLNVIIAALVATVLLYPAPVNASAPVTEPVDTEPTVHEKLRDAEEGKAEGILAETRLMGTGEERVVFSCEISGVLYIFGNATAAGLDFDGYGGFLCRLDETGKILGFTYFPGRMTAACIAESGFLVGITGEEDDKEVSRLYSVSPSGESADVGRIDGYAEDIFSIGGTSVAVITRPYGAIKLTEYSYAGGAWSASRGTRISSGLDIDYFDCYYAGGGYVIAARAYDAPHYDSLVFYSFEAGGNASPHYFGGKENSMLTPYAVMPYDGGYLAVCRRGGVATIATVDYTFTSYRRDSLEFSFDKASLFYAGGKYYACFDCPDGYVTYEIDGSLNRRKLSAADGCNVTCMVGSASAAFAAVTQDALTLRALKSGETVAFNIKGCVVYKIICSGGQATVVMSASGGDAVGAPTGASDVYVLRIKFAGA